MTLGLQRHAHPSSPRPCWPSVELHTAVKLFSFAKALLLERQRQESKAVILKLAHSLADTPSRKNHTDELQTLLCLAWFVTWQKDARLRNEVQEFRQLLAHSLVEGYGVDLYEDFGFAGLRDWGGGCFDGEG
ncbi:hypothetical protein BDV25DRAFT_136805 [Aspergillus avenaceus]|uniref:Uncharacterized protein n=1 Tax=Aspergillus avenaceus TaxID=36643 RepID=A0A5N6U4K6_ASPAV|nr:hypothetical protein BDV25DRAFT_136805 [Aspergillus avenaceus]